LAEGLTVWRGVFDIRLTLSSFNGPQILEKADKKNALLPDALLLPFSSLSPFRWARRDVFLPCLASKGILSHGEVVVKLKKSVDFFSGGFCELSPFGVIASARLTS
jgi:hypothetical protein